MAEETTVPEIIADQMRKADDAGRTVEELLGAMLDVANYNVFVPQPEFATGDFFDGVKNAAADLTSQAPLNPVITMPEISPPDTPTIQFETVAEIKIPDFNVSAPTLKLPTAPTMELPDAPFNAPEFVSPSVPLAPDFTLPAAPSTAAISVPELQNIELPTFMAVPPEFTAIAPSNQFAWAEEAFQSAILDAANAAILKDITEGGYGINTADELLVWDREGEREIAAREESLAQVTTALSSRNFAMPPGMLAEMVTTMETAALEASNTRSRDIAIKRYDQLFQARQFALTTGYNAVQLVLAYHGSKQERLLNAARATAELAISFYNVQIEQFRTRLQRWQTEAQVYQTLVAAAVERLNIDRARLEAARLKGELQRNELEKYRLQLSGFETLTSIFKARMEAARTQAEIEKAKQEAFRSRVDAYMSTVRAKEIEFNAYTAGVNGELAKVKVFETQAAAFREQVAAKRVAVEAQESKVRRDSEVARTKLALHESNLSRYFKTIDGKLDINRLLLAIFQGNVSLFQAKSGVASDIARLGIANFTANTTAYSDKLRYNLENTKFQFQNLVSDRDHKKEVLTAVTQFYTQIATGAVSSINTIAAQTTAQ